MKVICPYCECEAELVTGRVIYPRRPDLRTLRFYLCNPCDAYVGCHRDKSRKHGWVPFGKLANAELRRARNAAHREFDSLWQSQRMTRKEAYAWMASSMGITKKEAHIGDFTVEQCRQLVDLVSTLPEVAK